MHLRILSLFTARLFLCLTVLALLWLFIFVYIGIPLWATLPFAFAYIVLRMRSDREFNPVTWQDRPISKAEKMIFLGHVGLALAAAGVAIMRFMPSGSASGVAFAPIWLWCLYFYRKGAQRFVKPDRREDAAPG